MPDQKILDAFAMMWGLFPEPVMLIQKDRTILAVNQQASQMGISAGIRCSTLNQECEPGQSCKHCQANLALNSQQAVMKQSAKDGACILGYWVPVEGHAGLYVHFGIGMAKPLTLLTE